MTPEAERQSLIRRIALRKAMGLRIPHELNVRVNQLTLKALAQKPRRDWINVSKEAR